MNSREQCGKLDTLHIDGDTVEVECWLHVGHEGDHEDFDLGTWWLRDGE